MDKRDSRIKQKEDHELDTKIKDLESKRQNLEQQIVNEDNDNVVFSLLEQIDEIDNLINKTKYTQLEVKTDIKNLNSQYASQNESSSSLPSNEPQQLLMQLHTYDPSD